MKQLRKCVALILVVCLCLSLSVFAAAIDLQTDTLLMKSNVDLTKIHQGNSELDIVELHEPDYYLLSQTFDNGDYVIYLLHNEQVLSYSYTDVDEDTITTIILDSDGIPGQITSTSISRAVPPFDMQALPGSYTRVGAIEYLYGNGSNTRTGDIGYNRTVSSESYNLNGTYQNVTFFVSYIASLLAIPVGMASQIGGCILSIIGIEASRINFVIPNHYVDADIETMRWYAAWRGTEGNPGIVVGTKIFVKYEDNSSETYYKDQYYTVSDFRNHNTVLASLLYESGFWGWDETTGYVNRWLP